MAISRRPKPVSNSEKMPGIDVDALINKGGSIARQAEPITAGSDPVARVIVRVPSTVLAQIDQVVEARRIKMPRHTWLLEALFEKLERETAASD